MEEKEGDVIVLSPPLRGRSKRRRRGVSRPKRAALPRGTARSRLAYLPRVRSMQKSKWSTTIVPREFDVKLRYVDYRHSTDAGGTVTQIWRGNAPFDPDQTGVGSQPVGYDQLSAFYERYRVFGCRIRIQVHNADAVPTFCGIRADTGPTPTAFADIADFQSQIDGRGAWAESSTNPRSTITLKMYRTTAQMCNTNTNSDDTQTQALINSNPSFGWYYVFHAENADGGNLAIYVRTEITYYVRFFGLQALTYS